jgi:hypothetical protein
MGTDRLRVLGLALGSLALMVAAGWILDWFTLDIQAGGLPGLAGATDIGFDLRSVHATTADGSYGSAPLTSGAFGFYATISQATLWASVVLSVLIAVQCGSRLIAGQANASMTKVGYALGLGVLLAAIATAYMFGPNVGSYDVGSRQLTLAFSIERTWAPLAMLAGVALGIFALYSAQQDPTLAGVPPARALPVVTTTDKTPKAAAFTSMPIPRARMDSEPAIAVPRTSTQIPHPLRGKLRFAAVTAEVTRGGIDARRDDGSMVLVVWRDVVGVVVRRMPACYDGATFVDVVSTAGSTLRLLPWTRVTGDVVEPDPELRARAFAELVVKYCPDCQLDRATRAYLEQRGEAAQLPDVETLAAHDARLA